MATSAGTCDHHEPGNPSRVALLDAAKQLIESGRDREAVGLLESLVASDPAHAEVRLLIAQALTGAGRGDEARPHLERALEEPSSEGMAAAMLGYWHQARGHADQAKALFERSIEHSPRQSVAYYGWAQGNRFGSDHMPLLGRVEALARDESLPEEDRMNLLYVLGKGLSDLGEFERSMNCFDRANRAAFELNLAGRPFNRKAYADTIDATMATFTRELLHRHRGIGSNRRLPIFVVGMMRSGTTLVEQILSSHPDVGAAGEVDFWLDQGPRASDLLQRRVDTKALAKLIEHYAVLLKSLSPSTALVTDKMPQNFQMLGLIHLAYQRAPIIHVRRDPVDTCLSIYTTAYQQSPAFAHDRESIVFAYRQYERLMAHWRRVLPSDRFLEIDYETLVQEPGPLIRKMVAFCGLPWNEACLHPELNQRLVTTPSLCQVRQPINGSAVERWRRYEPWLGAFGQLRSIA